MPEPVAIEMFTATGALSDSTPWADIQRVTYELKQPTDRNAVGRDLVRSVVRNLLTMTTPDVEDQLMLSGVQDIKFSCYDGAQWQDTWDTTGVTSLNTNLPLAVRVDIQMAGDNNNNAQPIEMVVPIDSQSRTNMVPSTARPAETEIEMKLRTSNINVAERRRPAGERSDVVAALAKGSVLIIVLWVCIGLVSIALYFANSMTYELRASDNRVSGLAADQAIEGAARYVSYVLFNYATNGAVPDRTEFPARPCRSATRNSGSSAATRPARPTTGQNATEPAFGLIDEGSKLNLNTVNTNMLSYLPNMTVDFAKPSWTGAAPTASCRWITRRSAMFRNTRRLKPWTNCGWFMARRWICWPATTSTATACSTRTKKIPAARAR